MDELGPWLVARREPLIFNFPPEEVLPRYGAGWSWDDYNYGYAFERSPYPIYGDRLWLDYVPEGPEGRAHPAGHPSGGGLLPDLQPQPGLSTSVVGRAATPTAWAPTSRTATNFPLERPLSVSPEFTVRQLAGAFPGTEIRQGEAERPPREELTALTVPLPDTVYRKFLQDSDNYLAEQLLLQAAAARYGTLDEEMILDYATDTLFPGLGLGEVRYADGSGLSRYNLVMPRQMVTSGHGTGPGGRSRPAVGISAGGRGQRYP